MRHSRLLILLTACLLCVALTAAALTETPLKALWDSGCTLLFYTNNVTVDGEATFYLGDERFKTAKLHYVQDDCKSFYDLQLLTPRVEGHDKVTGWTIIADEHGDYAVMEAYTPGIYRMGVDAPQDTLLRRSVQLDALVDLGSLVAGQVVLPEGTLTVQEENGVRKTHLDIHDDQLPDLAVSALNLAANFLADRWFNSGYERSFPEEDGIAFENFVTVTQALTYGTARWVLTGLEMDCETDDQDRLTSVRGKLLAVSEFWNGPLRDVTVEFSLNMKDYGTSQVKPFVPGDYSVVLPWEVPGYTGN